MTSLLSVGSGVPVIVGVTSGVLEGVCVGPGVGVGTVGFFVTTFVGVRVTVILGVRVGATVRVAVTVLVADTLVEVVAAVVGPATIAPNVGAAEDCALTAVEIFCICCWSHAVRINPIMVRKRTTRTFTRTGIFCSCWVAALEITQLNKNTTTGRWLIR